LSRLAPLLEATTRRVEERRRRRSLADLESALAGAPPARPFAEALVRQGVAVIAEHKRRSPSAGSISEGASVAQIVEAFEDGGAAALSIITEQDHFGGSLDDLEAARAACDLPVLRKDFTLDRYQLYEARAAGADAVLLVVGTVSPGVLAELHAEARALDLDAIVEVHTEEDLEQALDVDADLIGINNRNLADLSVDLQTTFELLPEVPAGKTVVSESGISTRAHLEELERVGVDAVLIGEALMRAPDPAAALRELTQADEPGDERGAAPGPGG
jgi:indole-3-glycerol phosphate synthase